MVLSEPSSYKRCNQNVPSMSQLLKLWLEDEAAEDDGMEAASDAHLTVS